MKKFGLKILPSSRMAVGEVDSYNSDLSRCLAVIWDLIGADKNGFDDVEMPSFSTLEHLHEYVVHAARSCGFAALRVEQGADTLLRRDSPALLIDNDGKISVLNSAKGKNLEIFDPTLGEIITVRHANFQWSSIKIAYTFSRTFNMNKNIEKKPKVSIFSIIKNIGGWKRSFLQISILTLFMQLYVIGTPYYMQISIDSIVPSQDREFLFVLALGFCFFTIFNVVSSLLRSFVLLSSGTIIGFRLSTELAHRLLRLPMDWYGQRHIGDILSRFGSVTPIQQALTQGAIAAALDGVMTLSLVLIMFFYNVYLTLIAVAAFVLYFAVRIATFSLQRRSQEFVIAATAREQSVLIEAVRGVLTLRLFGAEQSQHAKWEQRFVRSTQANVSLSKIGIWQATFNGLIFGLENVASVWLAISIVLDNEFSIGMVFAFMAYKAQFLGRSSSLIDQVITFRMLGLHLERISDIALQEEDCTLQAVPQQSPITVNGRIELKNVRFSYGSSDLEILKGVDLEVPIGTCVAITGPSGAGKTTLAKVVLGLLPASEGTILVDGRPMSQLGFANFRRHCAAVMQADNIFSGSVAENIALFDPHPDLERVVAVATAASLHDEIKALSSGYGTIIGESGVSLSGGQEQRLFIARALYRRPKILIIDEGTANLDLLNEKKVNSAIRNLGITRLIIAHREESIKLADKAYRIEDGRLWEIKM